MTINLRTSVLNKFFQSKNEKIWFLYGIYSSRPKLKVNFLNFNNKNWVDIISNTFKELKSVVFLQKIDNLTWTLSLNVEYLILFFNKNKTQINYKNFLAGIIFANGNVTATNNKIRIEFKVKNNLEAEIVENIMQELDIHFQRTLKNNMNLFILQHLNSIVDFLFFCNVQKLGFKLLDQSINSEIKHKANLLTILKLSNEIKVVENSTREIYAIKHLTKSQKQNASKLEIEVWNFRLRHPSLSLSELSKKINENKNDNDKVSRSTIYRILKKVLQNK